MINPIQGLTSSSSFWALSHNIRTQFHFFGLLNTKSSLYLFFSHPLSGAVHTGVEVRRIDSEMSRLVERPWLQLMCCTICLPHGRNFRWREENPSGSEYWLVCRRWTLEVEFNKSLSSSIIRLAIYSVTTSLIYKLIV